MNNLSSKLFSAFGLIVLFVSILFSQDSFPDGGADPNSLKDQYRNQVPADRFNPEILVVGYKLVSVNLCKPNRCLF